MAQGMAEHAAHFLEPMEPLDHGSPARNGSLLEHGCANRSALLEFASQHINSLSVSPKNSLMDLTEKTYMQMAPMVFSLSTCSALGFADLDLMHGTCISLRTSCPVEDLCQCLGQSS